MLRRAELEQQGIEAHGDLIQRPAKQHAAKQDQPLITEPLNEGGRRAQQQTGKNAVTGVALFRRAASPPQRQHGHGAGQRIDEAGGHLTVPVRYLLPVHGKERPGDVTDEVEQQHHQAQAVDRRQAARLVLHRRLVARRLLTRRRQVATHQMHADGHLDEIAGGHHQKHIANVHDLQNQATQRSAENGAEVHHHRQGADGLGVVVLLLQAHHVGVHQQVAALEHHHQQRHHPEQRQRVDEIAGGGQAAGHQLRADQDAHRVHALGQARPERKHRHHHQADHRQIETDMLLRRIVETLGEILRIKRNDQVIGDHRQGGHHDQAGTQRHWRHSGKAAGPRMMPFPDWLTPIRTRIRKASNWHGVQRLTTC